ncbi:18387_t:CDS:2 [Funneliformis geosporum]|uniref:18387_t:CDS:1 n=1 Tax=Funneliformis geosporum TaxID=1117311 RepID=A0A9W4WZM2_9GLOM|nr:18387_t:CDS:2 [Funneliformis geosporum]
MNEPKLLGFNKSEFFHPSSKGYPKPIIDISNYGELAIRTTS